MDLRDTIIELSSMNGPSGFEGCVAARACELLRPYMDEVSVDVLGNVVGIRRCGKEGAKKLLVDAHIDEIGFVVTGIENGFLKFSTIGGVDPRMLPASEIRILTDPPTIGIVDTMPPHAMKPGDEEHSIEMDTLCIDVGMTQEEAEKAFPLGTPAVFNTSASVFGKDQIYGKALDDRACFASILKAVDMLKDAKLDVDLYVMGSTQEEVGLRGAQTGAFAADPDWAIVIDVTHAKTPDCKKQSINDLGQGAVITIGPNMNKWFTEQIIKIAKEKEIKYQIEIEPSGNSGTNARAVQVARSGVATALLSLPLKYMHTPVEVISGEDAESVAKLVYETVLSMWGGRNDG